MKDIRIGNDISVKWSLLVKGTSDPFDLSGLPLKLYLKNMYGRKEVEDFSVDGNTILWTFFGKDQKHTGKYSLELVANEGVEGMMTTDICDLVRLVSCSCKVGDGTDGCGVETETIEVQSEVEFVSGTSIEVDTELSETSMNPLANATVTAELKKKVSNTDLATINGQRIDEGGNIEIEGGSGSLTAEEVSSTEPTAEFPQVLYTEQSLTEEQKEQARENIGVSEAIEEAIAEIPAPESSVFEAVYGETTHDEIVAAANKKKHIICFYRNRIYNLTRYNPLGDLVFSCADEEVFTVTCKVSGGWSNTQFDYEQKYNKTKTINAESTDTQYPSAKAVYDFVGKQGVIRQTQTWTEAEDEGYDYVMSNLVRGAIPQANIDLFTSAGAVFNEESGYFELNGLTDISYEEMMNIHNYTIPFSIGVIAPQGVMLGRNLPIRTAYALKAKRYNIFSSGNWDYLFWDSWIERVKITEQIALGSLNTAFGLSKYLSVVDGVISLERTPSTSGIFANCWNLRSIQFAKLKASIEIKHSPRLTNASILYMIQNEIATSAIVITLHADAYARAMADTEITAALEAHPNVSLASA